MKQLILIYILSFSFIISAQSNNEVYLFDIKKNEDGIELNNKRNISNNMGYDNQPSFYNDSIILFASTRNKQTDIIAYNIKTHNKKWINQSSIGSEYSPIKIPNQKAISAIRLDTTGRQLLYNYNYNTGESKVLIKDLIIGYHRWYTENILISSIIDGKDLSLVVSNIKGKRHDTIQKKIGRSLHNIPNSNLISYISKEKELWEIKSLNPITSKTKKIINSLPGAEDMCWLSDGTILMGKENVLYKYHPKTDTKWNVYYSFDTTEINNISRIQTNNDDSMLALVSDNNTPENIVQKQLDAYNTRNIEAFMESYSDDIKIYNFPEQLTLSGKIEMKKQFEEMFKKTPNLHSQIKKRIILGNKVIDHEYVRFGKEFINIIAIYEIENNKISKVTFIR